MTGGIFCLQLLALAGLVGDAAAGLASRLAGSLALTAAAVLSTVAQIASLNGNDMLHGKYLHKIDRFDFIIKFCISQLPASVSFETFCPYGMIFSCTQKQISQKKHDDLAATAGKYLPMSAV